MMDLYIDETNLYNRMWLYTKQFDWEKMWAIADNITDEEAIRAKAQDILDTFDIEGGGTIEKGWDMLLPLSSGSRTKRLRLWLPTTTVLPRVWPANWTPC